VVAWQGSAVAVVRSARSILRFATTLPTVLSPRYFLLGRRLPPQTGSKDKIYIGGCCTAAVERSLLKPLLFLLVEEASGPSLSPGQELSLVVSLPPLLRQKPIETYRSRSPFHVLFFDVRSPCSCEKTCVILVRRRRRRCDSSWRTQREDISACGRRSGRGQRKSRRQAGTAGLMATAAALSEKAPAPDPAARARLPRERFHGGSRLVCA